MVSQIIQGSALTLAILVICLLAVVTVLAVCVYAHRHWHRLTRWNTRNRREQLVSRAARRRRAPWRMRSAV